ncbi:permease [Nocardia huaxiensis]|uniref:permease n=1 Tax=Nocardia huaxiensis TaxID=2755382 RepID=UPI001E5BEEAF|nr:permease [Nocardia huaxiensis]UFS99341.1 permease [Nocardia huaxiensis]
MTTPSDITPGADVPEQKRSTFVTWRNRIIALVLLAVILWVTYLILAAFLPRWWAQRIAEMVSGSFSKGIWYGLVMGVLCTLVPLLLLLLAGMTWRKRGGPFIAGAAVVLAVVAAVPNLLTLAIVAGNSNAAHAGERILDVDAPAFRGAVLTGAIVSAVLFLLVAFLLVRRRFRKHRAAKQRMEQEKQRVATEKPEPSQDPGAY